MFKIPKSFFKNVQFVFLIAFFFFFFIKLFFFFLKKEFFFKLKKVKKNNHEDLFNFAKDGMLLLKRTCFRRYFELVFD